MITILVVDDNAMTRKLVRFAFENQGMRVLEAADAAAALVTFAQEPLELVLQDLCLPDLDGFELVRRLRAMPGGAEVPILAFSGMLTAHDEVRVSAAGFDDLISKPVEPSRLVQIVRAHLPDKDRARVEPFGAGRLIIVADDDAVQRKLAAFKLEAAGFDVMLARDGAEALALARRTPPAAVLSDVLMPGIDGFALCAEMRRDAVLARIPLVLTTNSYVEPADRELALKAGAHGLVHRTPDLKDALAMLQQALLAQREFIEPSALSVAELEQEHKQRMMRQLERQVTLNAGINQRCALLSAEMAVLKGISEALASQGSTEDAVRRALAACFDAGGISLGALFQREGSSHKVMSFGFSEGGTEREVAGLWGELQLLEMVESQGAPVLLPGSEPAGQRLLERAGAASALLVPVPHCGVLLMLSKTTDLETNDRIAFAEAVAGQISQALAVTRAFARQEASERMAKERAALLRSILESIGDGVAVADRHGNFIQWNAAASELVKLGPWNAEFPTVGEGYGFYGEDQSTPLTPAQLPLVRAMEGESVQGMEMFVRHPGSSSGVWLSVSSCPWRDEGGQSHGGVAVFRDITGMKHTQSQLMVSDRMASVGMLAAGVAHEINNPLAALIANLDLCRTELASGGVEGVREMVNDAYEAAERVRMIVRDVKMFSRHEEPDAGSVDIDRVLESSLRMAGNELRHRAQLVRAFGPKMSVRGTESRLGQVFLNLLVNAAQAIPEGRAATNTVRVATRLISDEQLCVEISDTGPGIPPETLRHLFTPFFTTKPAGVGTGLGLAICQRIVSGFGGEIRVESEVGRGTTFRVLLSVVEAPREVPVVDRPKSEAKTRGSVLVVDDEELVGKALKRVLARQHDVVTVKSVDAAIELLRGGAKFDLIFSDLMMPEKSGIDLFKAIASLFPGQEERIVFVTGGAFTPTAKAFLSSVPNKWIDKPFQPEQLRAMVNERLSS